MESNERKIENNNNRSSIHIWKKEGGIQMTEDWAVLTSE